MKTCDSALRDKSADRLLSQFRVFSLAMKPYVQRIRLRGSDFDFGSTRETAEAFTKCIEEMRRILLKSRKVSALAADRAILKSLKYPIYTPLPRGTSLDQKRFDINQLLVHLLSKLRVDRRKATN